MDSLAFLELVKSGDMTAVMAELGKNKDLINSLDRQSHNVLYFAAQSGNAALLDRLISLGASPHQRDSQDRPLLSFALQLPNHRAVLQLLLARAAPVNARDLVPPPTSKTLLFYEKLLAEAPAFSALSKEEVDKVKITFAEIDFDSSGEITLEKALAFNLYVQKQRSRMVAEKDAREFIASAGMIEEGKVFPEEFIFAFGKLKVESQEVFDKFFADYQKKIEREGPLGAAQRAALLPPEEAEAKPSENPEAPTATAEPEKLVDKTPRA